MVDRDNSDEQESFFQFQDMSVVSQDNLVQRFANDDFRANKGNNAHNMRLILHESRIEEDTVDLDNMDSERTVMAPEVQGFLDDQDE